MTPRQSSRNRVVFAQLLPSVFDGRSVLRTQRTVIVVVGRERVLADRFTLRILGIWRDDADAIGRAKFVGAPAEWFKP